MANLDDILTTQKNGVVAINNVSTSIANVAASLGGSSTGVTSATVATTTLVVAGSGRLIGVSIIVAGSATGFIHNAATTGAASVANSIVATPVTVGFYPVTQYFTNGLVIVPGTGQSVNVTYSTD